MYADWSLSDSINQLIPAPEEINSDEAFKPFNLRSQIFWELRKSLIAGEIGSLTDEALKTELQTIKYDICSDRTVKVAGKEIIKKTLGKSPDRADVLAYANWVLKQNDYSTAHICLLPRGGRGDYW